MAITEKRKQELVKGTMGFCPGCGHNVVIRMIADVLTELEQDKNVIYGIGVGCSSLLGGGLHADRIHCPHGRAGAIATAMKRVNPENIVLTYQGDGDAYSIGLGETTAAAYRGENITVFIINNTNYGMTGGQMSHTTLPGQKTATSIYGRDCSLTGAPLRFPELVAANFNPAYAARGSVHNSENVARTKEMIKEALLAQMNGEGYSVVEILTSCPTNWNLSALEAMKRIENEMVPYFPIGEFAKREVK
ncbi:MAG: 2-oxoglutarate oxidoreductase [Tissierellia bacterium]|nr:2-oxoglutarate oxidoreductase [Tissierellia bacterium]